MLTVVPESAADDDRTGGVQLGESSSLIDDIVREGARRMLAEALVSEADALWVPNWSSTSCDLGVFVYQPAE